MNKLYLLPILFAMAIAILYYTGRIDPERLPETIVAEDLTHALQVAETFEKDWYMVTGSSMVPLIPHKGPGEINAVALTDETKYKNLGIGDVVIYIGPTGPTIHMIASKHGYRYMLRGLGNVRVDGYYLTEDMFIGRVSTIILWP